MSIRSSFTLLLLVLPLSACSSATEEPPTLVAVPTAVVPAEVSGNWAISFELAFPPSFWPVGPHEYGFFISCPELGQVDDVGASHSFQVSDAATRLEGPVYLRLAGLSTGLLAPINLEAIHPEQDTIAVVTIGGISEAQAEAAASSPDCEIAFGWDGVGVEILLAGPPFQP